MFKKVFNFYKEGFSNMSKPSKKLWMIIIIKLVIMFAILKVFFFPDFLNSKYNTDEEKSNHVIEQLINKNQ